MGIDISDKTILYQAFVRYRECCGKGKKTPVLSQEKVIDLRGELLQQVEKYVLLFNSAKTSVVEKRALCNKGKMLYQKYCFQMKVNPKVDTPRLAEKMDELLHFIAACEVERFQYVRERQAVGEKIDLEQLFTEDKHIRIFIGQPLDAAVEEIFSNRNYTVVGDDHATVYRTAGGAKYHRRDCPYCKGRVLVETSLLKVDDMGLKPCKCMMSYATAFVDESIRSNPWRKMDESLPEKQGLYSYIICRGMLTSEELITVENTLCTGVKDVTRVQGTGDAAMEAVLEVLFRLAADGYEENVLIYTDNIEARDCWYKSAASKNLSKLFASVMVCYIPREANRKADRLGRERAVMNLPMETMMQILERCNEYSALHEEMSFVRSYFPVPMKNIPNLLMELNALADGGRRE